MCPVFCDRKGVILLDFLEPRQNINSDRYIAMPTKLKARISRVRPEKKATFLLQTITPGLIPVWRPWSTLQSLARLSCHTHQIVRILRLLTSSVRTGVRWTTRATVFWQRSSHRRCGKVGRLRWCKLLQAQHAGSCSSLAKMHIQWWRLCGR
jgi:hypothetical protein